MTNSLVSARPATLTQQGIWINEMLGDCRSAHHVVFAVRFAGNVDVQALKNACDAIVRRRPALRNVVEERDGVPFLVPGPTMPEVVTEAASDREFIQAPFDLRKGPLCRMLLERGEPGRYRLLVVVHHLIFDGRAMELFVADLAALYQAESGPVEVSLPADADLEDRRMQAQWAEAKEYWHDKPLGTDDPELPGLDRATWGAAPGDAVELVFPRDLRDRIMDAAVRLGVTFFELIVASVHALLFRYGNTVPVTALDLSTRPAELSEDMNPYVNEPPFSSSPRPDSSFADFAQEIRAGLRRLYRVRNVPLGRLGLPIRPGLALAPISVSYRRVPSAPFFPGVTAEVDWALPNYTSRNVLRIELVDAPDGARAMMLFPAGAWPHDAASQFGRHWQTMLEHVSAAPETPVGDIPLFSREERGRLLAEGNDTARADPDRTVVELFNEQVAARPLSTAVVFGDRRMTYAEIDELTDRIANGLRSRGVRPGSLVALRLERSEMLVAALLGVLKAGAAYIPLDPGYPAARLDLIREDSGAACEIGDDDLTAMCGGGPVTDPAPVSSVDLAYVLYTSGSTGRPKGVQIEQRALVALLHAMRDLLAAGPGHRWLALTSVSFDIAQLELLLPLVTGGTVVVAGDRQRLDSTALRQLISTEVVTHVQATPTTWAMLLAAGFEGPDIVALCGGEALPLGLARRLRPAVARLWNVYGPTETTIWSTSDEVAADADVVTIGRPLPNERLYLLDSRLSPVPPGVAGDLYIAGTGLARGYLGRYALTGQRFVADPYGPAGARMYWTGDRARHRPDGRLEFLGRVDDQIKLRGFRIELGEIEAALSAVPGVVHAAAAVRDDRLVGYHTGTGDEATIRRHLADVLPAYMVPEVLVRLDTLPTTPNGKLARAALPDPPARRPETVETSDESSLEVVRAAWCEALGMPHVDDDESLFSLGGHSMTMAQIAVKIFDATGVDLPLFVFFEDPTVRGVAEKLVEFSASR